MQDVFVHTQTMDYDAWYAIFSDTRPPTREEYGIHTVSVSRDVSNPNNVMLHLRVEDLGRMREYLGLDAFKRFSGEAGVVGRQMWFGEEQPAPPV